MLIDLGCDKIWTFRDLTIADLDYISLAMLPVENTRGVTVR
jgi:hypothetical protein